MYDSALQRLHSKFETAVLDDNHLKVIESDSDTLFNTIKDLITNNDELEVIESLMTDLQTIIKPLNDIVIHLMSGRNEQM